MAQTGADGVFDQPFRWRWEASEALGMHDEDRMAALSPGPAYPSVLRSIVSTGAIGAGLIVDVGAGAGGGSEWLRRATGATVVAVDPSRGACSTAHDAFPELSVVRAEATSTGLVGGCAHLVTVCGLLSLVNDAAPVLAECRRLLASGGFLAVADLFATELAVIRSGPNTFRGVDHLTVVLADAGFSITDVGVAPAAVAPRWVHAVDQVDTWIRRHRSMEKGFGDWFADRQHLRRHMSSGELMSACVVASAR